MENKDKRISNREARAKQVKRTKFNIVTIITILIINCSIICFSIFSSAEEITPEYTDVHYYSIEVSSNDTLWELAQEYKSDLNKSTKETVEEIMELNNLSNDKIYAGQYLIVASCMVCD
ncbi:MAG: LysM peptidoglycan-binding domain-containing protein [Eubacteriales bacterium]